jgi:nicotinamide-nucleotide amidase
MDGEPGGARTDGTVTDGTAAGGTAAGDSAADGTVAGGTAADGTVTGGGTPDGTGPAAAAREIVRLLTEAGLTVAVAESLTGGLVVASLVAVPGASRCVRGGVVAYATDLKANLLDVPASLLQEHGAVHPDVARAMASGVRQRLRADYGLATTGVAGPDPQDGWAPGTFHVAVEGPGGGQVVSVAGDHRAVGATGTETPPGGAAAAGGPGRAEELARGRIRRAAVHAALELLLAHCRSERAASR